MKQSNRSYDIPFNGETERRALFREYASLGMDQRRLIQSEVRGRGTATMMAIAPLVKLFLMAQRGLRTET